MSPESQIIARAQQEYNTGALVERYDLIRQQFALMSGQAVIGAEARTQYQVEQRAKQDLDEHREKQSLYDEQNAKFIKSSVRMLPSIRASYGNVPKNYLVLQGLVDRVVWLESDKYPQRTPAYVIGANPKKGLVTGTQRVDGLRIETNTSRPAKKLARHFSKIMANPNPAVLEELYDPASNTFRMTSDHSQAKVLKRHHIESHYKYFPDAYLHEYGVITHLMHLSALFNVQHKWGKLLKAHTDNAPEGEIAQLKGIFEAQFGKQPELPPESKRLTKEQRERRREVRALAGITPEMSKDEKQQRLRVARRRLKGLHPEC